MHYKLICHKSGSVSITSFDQHEIVTAVAHWLEGLGNDVVVVMDGDTFSREDNRRRNDMKFNPIIFKSEAHAAQD
jgi:hypothetical protein